MTRPSLLLSLTMALGCGAATTPPPPTPDAVPAAPGSSLPDAAAPTPVEATPADAAPQAPPPPADAAAPADTAPAVATPGSEPPVTAPDAYACTLVLGVKETGEWFNAGFETIVENARWEVVPIHDGHIELWADPKNNMWSLTPQSPCPKGAAAPDRVVFCGVNYDYTTTAEFVPKYMAVIDNIKTRYPTVKRVDIMTLVRSPKNVPCPGNLAIKTWIRPAQDESIQMISAAYPGFVFAAPRFEVRSCADFSMPPHFAAGAAAAAAKQIGAYYLTH